MSIENEVEEKKETSTYEAFIEALKNLTPNDIIMLSEFSSFEEEVMSCQSIYDAIEDCDLCNIQENHLNNNLCIQRQEYHCGMSFKTIFLDLFYKRNEKYPDYMEFDRYEISK